MAEDNSEKPVPPVVPPEVPRPHMEGVPQWLHQEEDDEENFDRELAALTGSPSGSSILRPILMVAVIFFIFGMLKDWEDDLRYFFSSSEPVEIGDVTEFPVLAARDSAWSPELPHNRYVKLNGVPSRRSQSEKYRYFKLVGAEIYVEEPRDDIITNRFEREFARPDPGEVDRTYFEGEGRLMSFARLPGRYNGLRHYYGTRYNTRYCEQYDERQLQELLRQRRETILYHWREQYQSASEQEREEKQLRPQPTEEELNEVLYSEPLCVEAYFVQAGVTPKSLWVTVVFAGFLSLFMVFNGVMIIRWFWRFARRK